MKKTISYPVIVSCLALGISLAHADPGWQGGAMRGNTEGGILKNADADGDGAITKSEYDTFHANRFKEMDSNGDGKIVLDEMRSARKKTLESGKGKRFDEADANHDGVLSREETEKMPRMSRRFDEMDADKDGKVTREEMQAAMKKMRRSSDEKKRPD